MAETMQHRSAGFDVVLGNPPWERIKLQEKEFFASRDPVIAGAPNAAARKKAISALKDTNPSLLDEFRKATRSAEGESHLLRSSGRYPLCGRGDINTYMLFSELNLQILGRCARFGCIVPPGIATDDSTKAFFQYLVKEWRLVSLVAFENAKRIFRDLKTTYRFALLTLTSDGQVDRPAQFSFFLTAIEELNDADRRFSLSRADIMRLNPNTLTCPIFRRKRDADLAKAIYLRTHILWKEGSKTGNRFGIRFQRMFDMTNDAEHFRLRDELDGAGASWTGLFADVDRQGRYIPMWEDWMIHHFDHRFQSNGGVLTETKDHQDPDFCVEPRYWVRDATVRERSGDATWMFAFRNRTNVADSRSVIGSIVPVRAAGNTVPVIYSEEARPLAWLAGLLSSFALDYSARQKIGGMNLNYFLLKQLPVPELSECACRELGFVFGIWGRLVELNFTAWDLREFALDLGYNGPPFIWDEQRRFLIRCELDAAYFHLYGIERDDVDYIMETFPIVKRKDIARTADADCEDGSYVTKDTILAIYDEMAEVMQTNAAAVAAGRQPTARYQTRLDPPPGPPMDAEGNFIPMAQWDRANWPPHIHPPKEECIAVPAIPPAEKIADGVAVLYALTLLHTWGKAADRRSFELGMILMQKDALRERVLKKLAVSRGSSNAKVLDIGNMDEFLGELVGTNTLAVENIESKQIVKLGAAAPTKEELLADQDGKAAFVKAEQATKAVAILAAQIQSLDLYMGTEDYGPVEIAIS